MESTTSTKSEEFVAVLPDDSLEAAPGGMPPPLVAANLVPKEVRRPRTPTLSPHNHQVRPQRPHLRGGGVAPRVTNNHVYFAGDGNAGPETTPRLSNQRVFSRQSMKSSVEIRQRVQDALDTAKAAELALREMISSWRAAK